LHSHCTLYHPVNFHLLWKSRHQLTRSLFFALLMDRINTRALLQHIISYWKIICVYLRNELKIAIKDHFFLSISFASRCWKYRSSDFTATDCVYTNI
jgi:hypothetical protein